MSKPIMNSIDKYLGFRASNAMTEEEKLALYGQIFIYLLKGQTFKELQNHEDAERYVPWDFGTKTLRDGYLHSVVKVWIYRMSKHTDVDAIEEGRRYGIREEDLALIEALEDESLWNYCQALLAYGWKCPTPMQMERSIVKSVKLLRAENYLSKFVWVKMKFLTNLYGKTLPELECDIESAGYAGVIHSFPRVWDLDHVRTLLIQYAKYKGHEIIRDAKAQKRDRVVTDGSGSVVVTHFSLNYFSADSDGMDLGAQSGIMGGESYSADEFILDLRITLEQVRDLLCPIGNRVLTFLHGYYDEAFTKWLHKWEQIPLTMTNDDFFLLKTEEDNYKNAIRAYLMITKQEWDEILDDIRKFLRAYDHKLPV